MIVGARIALPALVVALVGQWLKPYLVSIGWLEAGAPFRKIGFIIALGTILGAAIVDVGLILIQAVNRFRRQGTTAVQPAPDWKRVNMFRLVLWVVFWGAGVVIVGSQVLQQPVFFLMVAVGLCFLFVLVNGISIGISDSNPISSAFVMTVFILAALGLKDPGVGLMCASILLIACSDGGDMQQDRSTGWRLGTNRVVQFRYQVIGIAMGAVLAVALAKIFMSAYPVLRVDQFSNPQVEGAQQWQSAMTYKFVGALKGITNPQAARDEGAAPGHPHRIAHRNRPQAAQTQPALPGILHAHASRPRDGFRARCVPPAQPLRLIFRRICGIPDHDLVGGGRCAGSAV